MNGHELEGLRRSLAMSPSLPPDAAAELIEALALIIADKSALKCLAGDLERIATELRRVAK